MEFYRYAFLFLFGGVIGWIIELFFRRFVSQKKWVNPGFLTGPFLPLYGFGIVLFYFLCSLSWNEWIKIEWLAYLVEILTIGFLMTLLEYLAGIIFIKGLKIKLWDYSNRPGNIGGIICPLFSFIWFIAGILYLYLLHPLMVRLTNTLINSDNILVIATLIGFFLGILVLDFGYSMHLAARIRKAIKDSKLVLSWEKLKIYAQDKAIEMKKKAPRLFFFSEKISSLSTLAKEYADKIKESTKNKSHFNRNMDDKIKNDDGKNDKE